MGRAIVTNGDFTAYVCDSAATRPFSQITLGRLVMKLLPIIRRYVYSQVDNVRPESDDYYSDVTSRPGRAAHPRDSQAGNWSNHDASNYAAIDHRAHNA